MSLPLPPVLVVDDEKKNMRLSLQTVLADEGYTAQAVDSAETALLLLAREDFFMVITDARLGGMNGYEFLTRLHNQWPEIPALMITAYATPKLAVEAIKAGAMDYLSKPYAPEELLHAVGRCAERYRLLQENAALRARTNEAAGLEDIVGESPKMRELRDLIRTVAPTDARVLVLGESGTGKELVAGAIHSLSQRRKAAYVRINCAAIPETLLESELFGHEKGAFTGALKQKPGRVEEADGGTIFLDEIADMSRPLQAKLLRFLEDGSFTRVGGTQELRVNVRLIAATNRDIVQAIREDNFREDLFHRLNVVQFRLPPLRERGDDVGLLAAHFLRYFNSGMNKPVKSISQAARQKLAAHYWPGNVRELKNVIERALILEHTPEIQPVSLPDFKIETQLHKTAAPVPAGNESLDDLLGRFERELISSLLERNHFNLNKTAEQLKISRHALRYRMQRLNIHLAEDAEAATEGGVLMHMIPQIFAAGLVERFRTWSAETSGAFQTLVFFGVVTVLALLVFGWAVMVRQQPRHRHHHHRSHSASSDLPGEEGSGRGFFRRRKHRRKEHRPANPTLSETGGLPAPRDGKTPPRSQL